MAENLPADAKDSTRAEVTILKLSDHFSATASAKSVYGEPVHTGNRTIVPVARVGYGLGATSGGRNGEPLEGRRWWWSWRSTRRLHRDYR
jgi:uncharacterized spore protein YtfJ